MVDIRIEYADGRQGYVEVWTDMQPAYAATHSELRKPERRLPREIRMGTLRRDWFLTLSPRSILRSLEAETVLSLVDPILRRIPAPAQ